MGLSLQDQLLKAGLADKKKANNIKKQKHKQRKDQQKHKVFVEDESKKLAAEALAAKKEKSQDSNASINQAAQHKALQAQIKQLIEVNKQAKSGEVLLNFTDDSVIKRLYVSEDIHKAVTRAKLAVVRGVEGYELVPTPVYQKIAERDESYLVYLAQVQQTEASESDQQQDEWYGDYEIPDDLMW